MPRLGRDLPHCTQPLECIESGLYLNRGHMKSFATKLGQILALYGIGGLFAISFLDSSLVPLPGLNDLVLILMASKRPGWWPMCALASTLGSVGGAYLLYGIARGGRTLFFRRTTTHDVTYARRWLRRNDFAAVLVTSLLPPPAPLKAFIFAAGLLRVNAVRFGLAMLVGRALRFAADAWLGAHYGIRAQELVRQNVLWSSIAIIVLIIALALVQKWWVQRTDRIPPSP